MFRLYLVALRPLYRKLLHPVSDSNIEGSSVRSEARGYHMVNYSTKYE
jgi:hypothetical protein